MCHEDDGKPLLTINCSGDLAHNPHLDQLPCRFLRGYLDLNCGSDSTAKIKDSVMCFCTFRVKRLGQGQVSQLEGRRGQRRKLTISESVLMLELQQ